MLSAERIGKKSSYRSTQTSAQGLDSFFERAGKLKTKMDRHHRRQFLSSSAEFVKSASSRVPCDINIKRSESSKFTYERLG